MEEATRKIKPVSIEAQEIVRRLTHCKVGDFVSWADLSKIVMGDIQANKRFAWTTAQKILWREHRLDFGVIRGEGVKCLSSGETIDGVKIYPQKAHRLMKKGLKRLATVDYDGLTDEEKRGYNSQLSGLGVLSHITKRKQIQKIEEVCKQNSERLMIDQTLDLFKSQRSGTEPSAAKLSGVDRSLAQLN